MFLGLTRYRRLRLNIEGNRVHAIDCVNLLGVGIDSNLKVDKHIRTLCSKVHMRATAFSRLNTYISREQALLLAIWYSYRISSIAL